LVFNLTLGN